MLSKAEALDVAQALLDRELGPNEPELVIDLEEVEEKEGVLIVPFNSPTFLETREPRDMVLDCWPVLVDLESGEARMSTIDDRPFLSG